jgi:hypothetical protein
MRDDRSTIDAHKPALAWPGRVVTLVFHGRTVRGKVLARALVRTFEQGFVDAAELFIRAGMDGCLHMHGHRCLVGLATGRLPQTIGPAYPVSYPTRAERAWSFFCFGLHNLALSVADMLLLWVVLSLTTVRFFAVKPAAGWLMSVYLLWVTFASTLNVALWRLNR